MDDALIEAAETAARNARRAAGLTILAVAVAVLVLAIDNSIKRAIVAEKNTALAILGEFRQMAADTAEAVIREQARHRDTGGAGAGGNSGDDVVRDPGTGTVLAAAGGAGKAPRAKRTAGPQRRPAGDGG